MRPHTVGCILVAFNGDRQKKEIPGRKGRWEIKAEEDQDGREQRDTDTLTLILSDGFMRVCACVDTCRYTHALRTCQSTAIRNVKCQIQLSRKRVPVANFSLY